MILLALAAAAAAQPVAEAERAFAAMAQAKGQWTAFRAFMAPNAIRLAPGVTPAAALLAGRKDPPHAIEWRPARTVTSCDGSLAFSTGPWRLDGETGRFFTIWQRQPDGGWKWLFDGGVPNRPGVVHPYGGGTDERTADCKNPPHPASPAGEAGGHARDGTLIWSIGAAPIVGSGRVLRVEYPEAGRWVVFDVSL